MSIDYFSQRESFISTCKNITNTTGGEMIWAYLRQIYALGDHTFTLLSR